MNPGDIRIADFSYHLPEEKIAFEPLKKRDEARLLVYSNGEITSDNFSNLAGFLPENSLLILNNTKVINARLLFRKSTGAKIEVFCLEPAGAIRDYASVMQQKNTCEWICLVGGIAKWTDGPLSMNLTINGTPSVLQAVLIERKKDANKVQFNWTGNFSFIEIIEAAGAVPLPPYIKREPEKSDELRYQTVFAQADGSVAAPTAGLHFTEEVFNALHQRDISIAELTLHVGAGTFMPVKTDTMQDHEMHEEYIEVSADLLEQLINEPCIIAVGTTALRTLESIYWLGCKAFIHSQASQLILDQWDAYNETLLETKLSKPEALLQLLNWMQRNGTEKLFTKTKLLIVPGYKFRVTDYLSTNFHQPHSTLLLLVAAAIGEDWRKVYEYALQNNFRFLSYGDTSLLKIANKA